MALKDEERAALTRSVDDCRADLEGEFHDQLERIYGFTREGTPRPINDLPLTSVERGAARQLRDWHRHLVSLIPAAPGQELAVASGAKAGEKDLARRQRTAALRMVEETAFTVLHRLAALRMAEERDVLRPCLRDGLRSDGFRLYLQLSGGTLGREEEAYRTFLECIFGEVGQDLPALFDRREPRSLLFPRPACLERIVNHLTRAELGRAWQDDETIGWVYQDFHSADERRELRRGVDVPRDSRELAIRNQLFTPRWVVEFLTDNTLGRLWLEMAGGDSDIADSCAFLLRGDAMAPLEPKDPRCIRILDPACGSGHFLLYAFDLLEHVYREAWERHVGTSPGRTPVWIEFPDRKAYERQVPALILRHNLFGVDIDPRPVQVAALALWLRAQRSWRSQGLPFAERPRIERMNLVCAEPMPGDPAALEAFIRDLQPRVLGNLVRRVWAAMQRVGEMGLLLRLDQRIRDIVREERNAWSEAVEPQQPEFDADTTNWAGPRHDLHHLAVDEAARFWANAEERVTQALAQYAETAEDDERVLRRLFAEDAERGLALIDLSRIRYDVVLMNPPFGQPAENTKDELDSAYPECGHEIYAMFFQRALELLEPHGRVGAITNRTWLTNQVMESFRRKLMDTGVAVVVGADLGGFVLEALVETAAVVLDRRGTTSREESWFRLTATRSKEALLYSLLQSGGTPSIHSFTIPSARYKCLPYLVHAFWVSEQVASLCACETSPTSLGLLVERGSDAIPIERYVRTAWEIPPHEIGLVKKWPRYAKGGEFRYFWDDIHLVVKWNCDGSELYANSRCRICNPHLYGHRGVTWPLRSTSPFCPRILNDGCTFAGVSPAAFSPAAIRDWSPMLLLGVLASRPYLYLLSLQLGAADCRPGGAAKTYQVGVVSTTPLPKEGTGWREAIALLTERAVELVRERQVEDDTTGETCTAFSGPPALLTGRHESLPVAARRRVEAREDSFAELADIRLEIDRLTALAYGLTNRDWNLLDEEMEPCVAHFTEPEHMPDPELFARAYLTKEPLPGDQLPGGLDAETDVRVEHRRRRQHASLRTEEDLCRVFELPPQSVTLMRRRLDILRDEDLHRCAADIVSWAVGVAFGRWDVRLLDHPEWAPGWPDPFGPLPRCPLGQLVDGTALPATRDRIASEAWLAARKNATSLPPVASNDDGTLWLVDEEGVSVAPAEVEASAYPMPVAWDGILQDDRLDDASAARNIDDLYRRVGQVLEHVYGAAHAEREAELAQALRARSLCEWLRQPKGLFADHLGRYTKSHRKAPIYWPLSTTSGGFTLWLYYPRFSAEMLAACLNRLHRNDEALTREEQRLLALEAEKERSPATQALLERLAIERRERADLRSVLRTLVDRGLQPHLDDGAVINAAPFAQCFRHLAWRTAAEEAWTALQAGEHDWSHMAMWLRPKEVLERCKRERDLAIAHGREDLFESTVPRRGQGRRTPRAVQLSLLDGEGG